MNKFFDAGDEFFEIPYSMGKKLKTTQYVNMNESDRDYLRYMYGMLLSNIYCTVIYCCTINGFKVLYS